MVSMMQAGTISMPQGQGQGEGEGTQAPNADPQEAAKRFVEDFAGFSKLKSKLAVRTKPYP
jgi:hypothetical protein